MKPRFRLFAGPNGSGKSSLFLHLRKKGEIHTEIYVSADRIEADILKDGKFNFNAYRVQVNQLEFIEHIQQSGLLSKMTNNHVLDGLKLEKGILYINLNDRHSYTASFIATYLAGKLLDTKQSFCFETVMSHTSKIELLKKATEKGFKTYLYFVFTDNPLLNQLRVKLRVKEGGHDVDSEKINDRFYRSFKNLPDALALAETSFLINNSINFEIVGQSKNKVFSWRTKSPPEVLKTYSNL
jgi:predicted ABC-type ATPase